MYQTSGRILRGSLKIRNRGQMLEHLKHWRDGEVTLTIERKHAHRSLAANRWYWGVVVHAIAEHTGYTPDETHAVLKAMFLPKHVALVNGNGEVINELVIGGSTAKLNQNEFSQYVEAVRAFALEKFDLDIPSPSEPDAPQLPEAYPSVE